MKKLFAVCLLFCMLFVNAAALNEPCQTDSQVNEPPLPLTIGITETHPSEDPWNPVHYLPDVDFIIPADDGELIHLYASDGWWTPWYIGFIIDDEMGVCRLFYNDIDNFITVENENGEVMYYEPGQVAEFHTTAYGNDDCITQVYLMYNEIWCYSTIDTASSIVNLYRK